MKIPFEKIDRNSLVEDWYHLVSDSKIVRESDFVLTKGEDGSYLVVKDRYDLTKELNSELEYKEIDKVFVANKPRD